jgi:hypothetical protein
MVKLPPSFILCGFSGSFGDCDRDRDRDCDPDRDRDCDPDRDRDCDRAPRRPLRPLRGSHGLPCDDDRESSSNAAIEKSDSADEALDTLVLGSDDTLLLATDVGASSGV